jgi:aminoglycoside/choline kinase family phosphotransferase
MSETDQRQREAASWAARTMGVESVRLTPVSGDASFRRYFRFFMGRRSIILMDAPPEKEDSAPFVEIAGRLRCAGLKAPEILYFNLERGFGLLEDFGDTLYRELISEESVDKLFPELFGVLHDMACGVDTRGLPTYSESALSRDLELFRNWYLDVHRKRPLDENDMPVWDRVCNLLIASAREQPQVFVHKDFHSCNLLRTPDGPGIIDFQDGVRGPVSYDFASLIWDRYIPWPRDRIELWMKEIHTALALNCSLSEWVRWCDWMGLQRNLKVVGIFARLKHRDGKLGYIEMLPRFYQYLLDVMPLYPEFAEFQTLLEQKECAP